MSSSIWTSYSPAFGDGLRTQAPIQDGPEAGEVLFLHDLITHFEKKGTRGSGIESYVKAVKNWMIWNDIDPPKNIRIYGASEYKKYENEVAPTRQELRRILDVAEKRPKVSISLMAFCGFSPEASPPGGGSRMSLSLLSSSSSP